MNTVFVYGTLKRGFHNHNRHLANSGTTFLGKASTISKYDLVVMGLPYLLPGEGEHRVRGELYEVSDAVLASLDRLEGHPTFYQRHQIYVQPDEGAPVIAWVYFYQGDVAPGMKTVAEYA